MRKKIFLLIILFSLFFFKSVRAGSSDNVFGWAWAGGHQINGVATASIGWLSFNNCSTSAECSGINYGVRISPSTGYISGYLWSGGGRDSVLATDTAVLGWISFNRNETGNPPIDLCSGQCLAKLEDGWQNKLGQENVKVKGWARVLSATNTSLSGNWDGWIRFDHGKTDYEVYIDSQGYFHGWAWSDGPLGAISFNSQDSGAGGANYRVWVNLNDFNQPPQVKNPSESIQYCFHFIKQARAQLNWQYFDPSPVSTGQKAYQIRVEQEDSPGNWTTKIDCYQESSANSFVFYIYRVLPTDLNCVTREQINYGKRIRWRVQVFDQQGASSTWSAWREISLAPHAYPWPSFTWTLQRPTVGQVVQFFDQSICFDNSMNETSCASWFWTFTNGNPYNSNQRNPTTTFSQIATSQITLFVADSSGQGCTTSAQLTIIYPLPRWKEIPPIIWLRKAIAIISQFHRFK